MLWDSFYNETVVELHRDSIYWHSTVTVIGTLSKGRLKGEVFPNVQAQSQETCKECKDYASVILYHGTTWRWVVSLTLLPCYP